VLDTASAMGPFHEYLELSCGDADVFVCNRFVEMLHYPKWLEKYGEAS